MNEDSCGGRRDATARPCGMMRRQGSRVREYQKAAVRIFTMNSRIDIPRIHGTIQTCYLDQTISNL